MPDRFTSRLRSGAALVADGATGTNLQARGLAAGVPPETWLFERPDEILSLHRSWVEAGSDLILTCTFGGNRFRLKGTNYASRVAEVNERAVALAREATTGTDVFVAASIGPTGLLLEPFGTLKREEAHVAFMEQARGLAGADLFVVETFFGLEEARAAVDAIQEVSDLPIVVSFSYDRGKKTMMGVAPADVARVFRSMGVTALGANCGRSLQDYDDILASYKEAAPEMPLWIKPNAGLPHGEGCTYDVTPEEMAGHGARFVREGARVVGGCCGSTPEHIRALASAVHIPVTSRELD